MAILRRSVSEKRAFELIASGASISAQTALEHGIINRVVATNELDREAEDFVANLAAKSTSALTLAKELFYRTDTMQFEAAVDAGAEVNAFARTTYDFKRGVEKFLKKS